MKNDTVKQLKAWKRMLMSRDNSVDLLIAKLEKIYGIQIREDVEMKLWFSKPSVEPASHLAAFFERWDLLLFFLKFQNGTCVNPWHTNRYRERTIEIIEKTKSHLTNPQAKECYERIKDLEKYYCHKADHGILLLGKICRACENCEKIVTVPKERS